MVGFKAAVEIINENLRKGEGPKSSKAARSLLDSTMRFGPNTPGLDQLRSDLQQLILNLESEELRKKRVTALPIPATRVAQVVPLIPQREVPDVVDFKLAVGRQDLRAQLAVQMSKANHDEWMANGCED